MAQQHRPEAHPGPAHPQRGRQASRAETGAGMGPGPTLISVELLLKAEPSNSAEYYDGIVAAMNTFAALYQVDTPLRVAHFLAQIGHESHFKPIEENGNYSPKRMREIFGCRGGASRYNDVADECLLGPGARLRPKLWLDEARYAHNPANLLSYVYASRFDNGDEASGDGFRYRGRGLIQLTFKANYQAFTDRHNAKNPDDPQDFVLDPDLLVTQRKYAVESAFFFWDTTKLNEDADKDDLQAVTRKINGGLNGLPDRRARLVRIKQAMGI